MHDTVVIHHVHGFSSKPLIDSSSDRLAIDAPHNVPEIPTDKSHRPQTQERCQLGLIDILQHTADRGVSRKTIAQIEVRLEKTNESHLAQGAVDISLKTTCTHISRR